MGKRGGGVGFEVAEKESRGKFHEMDRKKKRLDKKIGNKRRSINLERKRGRAVNRLELATRKVAEKSTEWLWKDIKLVAFYFLTPYKVLTKN